MNFLKKIFSFFCSWRGSNESQNLSIDNEIDEIVYLDRIFNALNIVYQDQVAYFLRQREYLQDHHYDIVINIMQTLELNGAVKEISISNLTYYYYDERQLIAGMLIDIDYWNRMKDVNDTDVLIKILKINPDHEQHRNIVILWLKCEIDKIYLIEELEKYINNHRDIVEIYIYGANKLFEMYKQLIQVSEKEKATKLIDKVEKVIDTSIAVELRLHILHLKEKNEHQVFFSRIQDANRLDDIKALRNEVTLPFVREICQIKVNNTVKMELMDKKLSDDELIRLYYFTSEAKTQIEILSRVKTAFGFIYQESMRHGLALQADSAKTSLINSILTIKKKDVLKFSQEIFRICFQNHELAIMVCRDDRIVGLISKLVARETSKSDLIESLLILGGHISIIKQFYRLEPNSVEILKLGNSIVLINDTVAEGIYTTELSRYVCVSDMPKEGLVLIFNCFKDSYDDYDLKKSIMKKLISNNPQFE